MELSINELSELTGRDRRTITQRLAQLDYADGPKGAHLYDSTMALAAIYATDADGKSLEQAKKEQATENALLARARREEIQKTRVPIGIALEEIDAVTKATAAILKASKGKKLTEELINTLFAQFREIPARLKW